MMAAGLKLKTSQNRSFDFLVADFAGTKVLMTDPDRARVNGWLEPRDTGLTTMFLPT